MNKLSLSLICQLSSLQGEVIRRIEKMGHRVGESLVERVCRDNPRFRTELDAMIFLCKQFWLHLFNKQIDNLKTNNQVYKYCHKSNTPLSLPLIIGHVCSF